MVMEFETAPVTLARPLSGASSSLTTLMDPRNQPSCLIQLIQLCTQIDLSTEVPYMAN